MPQSRNGSYSIYQLKQTQELRYVRFCSYSALLAEGKDVCGKNYDKIYSGLLPEHQDLDSVLEGIFAKFNMDIPADFKGNSLSVSDVIVVEKGGETTAFYIDSFGFRDVPQFFDTLPGHSQSSMHYEPAEAGVSTKPSLNSIINSAQQKISGPSASDFADALSVLAKLVPDSFMQCLTSALVEELNLNREEVEVLCRSVCDGLLDEVKARFTDVINELESDGLSLSKRESLNNEYLELDCKIRQLEGMIQDSELSHDRSDGR